MHQQYIYVNHSYLSHRVYSASDSGLNTHIPIRMTGVETTSCVFQRSIDDCLDVIIINHGIGFSPSVYMILSSCLPFTPIHYIKTKLLRIIESLIRCFLKCSDFIARFSLYRKRIFCCEATGTKEYVIFFQCNPIVL
jgi:hypothetical protein